MCPCLSYHVESGDFECKAQSYETNILAQKDFQPIMPVTCPLLKGDITIKFDKEVKPKTFNIT